MNKAQRRYALRRLRFAPVSVVALLGISIAGRALEPTGHIDAFCVASFAAAVLRSLYTYVQHGDDTP